MVDVVAELLADQAGVVARRQLVAAGLTPTAITRLLRRRELTVRLPGVYLEHNGPPTWLQLAWAAVLHAAPAALCLESARRAAEGPGRRGGDPPVIDVAVTWPRKVAPAPGVRIHRVRGLDARVQWHLGPPRTAYDETVLDLAASARSDLDAVAVLADACGARRTTADRLLARLEARSRIRRRAWLASVLGDVAAGTCSVLEHGYLDRVVRPHGLPTGEMQAARLTSAGLAVRDVEHVDLGLAIELDGRWVHGTARQRDADLDRDLVAAVEASLTTVRLGWRQVHGDGCRTARHLAALMARHGWTGVHRPCAQCR